MSTGYQPHPREKMIRDRLAAASADTTTISEEALRRLNVEAAFGRGEKIEVNTDRRGQWIDWHLALPPSWDWAAHDYRVKLPVKPYRTKAQILDQIHELLVELRQLDYDA